MDLQLPVQSVPLTTNVVSSNHFHGEVYLIQHYVKFVTDFAGRWFSPGTLVSTTNKTDRHDITEILLQVALKTITLIKLSHHYLLRLLIKTTLSKNVTCHKNYFKGI